MRVFGKVRFTIDVVLLNAREIDRPENPHQGTGLTKLGKIPVTLEDARFYSLEFPGQDQLISTGLFACGNKGQRQNPGLSFTFQGLKVKVELLAKRFIRS